MYFDQLDATELLGIAIPFCHYQTIKSTKRKQEGKLILMSFWIRVWRGLGSFWVRVWIGLGGLWIRVWIGLRGFWVKVWIGLGGFSVRVLKRVRGFGMAKRYGHVL
jgi:hypothetical protein